MCVCARVCAFAFVYVRSGMCVRMRARVRVSACVCVCACVRACVPRACARVRTRVCSPLYLVSPPASLTLPFSQPLTNSLSTSYHRAVQMCARDKHTHTNTHKHRSPLALAPVSRSHTSAQSLHRPLQLPLSLPPSLPLPLPPSLSLSLSHKQTHTNIQKTGRTEIMCKCKEILGAKVCARVRACVVHAS